MNDRGRAVSHTVSFVLVFSLIVTSVGLVSVVGTGSIQDVVRFEQTEASVSLMRSAGSGINEVANGAAPAYRSSIALAGGSLRMGNRTEVNVTVSNASGTMFSETYRPWSIRYEANDRNVSYQSGLLARGGDRREGVLLTGAGFRCDPANDHASVTIVRLRPSGSTVFGGGPVTIRATEHQARAPSNRSGVSFPESRPHPTATEVIVSVDGPYETAWREALTNWGFSYDSATDTLECDVGRVFVQSPRVEVRLS